MKTKIFIIKVYNNDYHVEQTYAALHGNEEYNLNELYTIIQARKQKAYEKIRTKHMPKCLKFDLDAFIETLIHKYDFKRVDINIVEEWCTPC